MKGTGVDSRGPSSAGPGAPPSLRPAASFPFRPWVRKICLRAALWGFGALAVFSGLTWLLRDPESRPLSRAFGALAFYGLLFLVSLIKVWWTAGGAAVRLDADALAYQPLHTFRPKRIPLDAVLSCAPRPETQSLRLVYEAGADRAREFFLNLAVIHGRNEFLAELGERLEALGLERPPEVRNAWRRPGWREEEARG